MRYCNVRVSCFLIPSHTICSICKKVPEILNRKILICFLFTGRYRQIRLEKIFSLLLQHFNMRLHA